MRPLEGPPDHSIRKSTRAFLVKNLAAWVRCSTRVPTNPYTEKAHFKEELDHPHNSPRRPQSTAAPQHCDEKENGSSLSLTSFFSLFYHETLPALTPSVPCETVAHDFQDIQEAK